jgi:hypothetical protein
MSIIWSPLLGAWDCNWKTEYRPTHLRQPLPDFCLLYLPPRALTLALKLNISSLIWYDFLQSLSTGSDSWGFENCCFPQASQIVHNSVLNATAVARDVLAEICLTGASDNSSTRDTHISRCFKTLGVECMKPAFQKCQAYCSRSSNFATIHLQMASNLVKRQPQ